MIKHPFFRVLSSILATLLLIAAILMTLPAEPIEVPGKPNPKEVVTAVTG